MKLPRIHTVLEALNMHAQGKLVGMFEMPSSVYHHRKCPGVSRSYLWKMKGVTDAHFAHAIRNPDGFSRSLVLGNAVHTMVLEPHLYPTMYAVVEGDGRTAAVKQARAIAAGAGRIILSGDEESLVMGIKKAISSTAKAIAMLDGAKEVTFFWTDPNTGLLCKARPDVIHYTKGIFTDLKTAEDASPEAFMKSAAQWGYHVQVASCLDGIRLAIEQAELKVNFPIPDYFIFLVAEKSDPFLLAYYDLPAYFIDEGRKQWGRLLRRYALYLKRENSPEGFTDKIITLKPKAYMFEQEEENE